MSVELVIKDVSATMLDYELCRRQRAPLFRDFGRFYKRARHFSKANLLADCLFYDLYITHFVEGWASDGAPPHPGLFEEFFPTILGRLISPQGKLLLHVQSSDPDYFDPRAVVNEVLAPRQLRHLFLGDVPAPGNEVSGADAGNLVFEWPADALAYIAEQWFMSPQVTVEGYISHESALENLAAFFEREDTDQTMRQLLRMIDLGFRVWPDNNGLFVLTDKLDANALAARLAVTELNSALEQAKSRYLNQP